MKLRLKNNSVRLRLTQNEVSSFTASGYVEESIEFGVESHQRLIYRVESDAQTETMQAVFLNNRITISVPKLQANEWTNTAQIGIESSLEIGDGKVLRLLIEKDFACLEPRAGEDDAGAFPHPQQGKIC